VGKLLIQMMVFFLLEIFSSNAHAAGICEFLQELQPRLSDFGSLRGEFHSNLPQTWKATSAPDNFFCWLHAFEGTLQLHCNADYPLTAKTPALQFFENSVVATEKCPGGWERTERSGREDFRDVSLYSHNYNLIQFRFMPYMSEIDDDQELQPIWRVSLVMVETH
jgi:hypothetical protein